MEMVRSTSLRRRLVIPVVAISVLLCLGVVGVSYWAEHRIVDVMSDQLIRHMTMSIRDHVTIIMDVPPRALARLNNMLSRHRIPLNDPQAVARELNAVLKEEPEVDWVYFANSGGGIASSGRLADGTRVVLMTDNFKAGVVREYDSSPAGLPTTLRKVDGYVDFRDKPWYQAAQKTGRFSWTRPYLGSVEPILGISLSAPVYRNGRVVGVLGLDLILTRLSEFMRLQRLGRTGRAFLTDDQGYLVASSGTEPPVAVDRYGRQQRVHAADAADPVINAAASHLRRHPEIVTRSMQSGLKGFSFKDPDLGRIWAAVEAFPIAPGTSWLIVSALPSSEFLKDVRNARYLSLGLITLLIVGSVGMGFWTVDRVLYPLDALTDSARSIGQGEWPEVPETSRDDEIGVLARTLAEMTYSLRAAHAELEERVAQRTAELNQTVERLKEEVEERTRVAEALRAETAERLNVQAELREKEVMLLQQSRLAALGEMIGNIAHQWRQPLNILGLLVQELLVLHEKGQFSAEYLHSTVNKMLELIFHMSKTIDDFRDFARVDQEKKDFRMLEVVEKVVSLLEGSLKSQSITTSIAAAADPVVKGYRNQFSQVLLNILSNARDALAARSGVARTIVINVGTEGNKCVVTIADNGGGIPPDIMDKIFDPYFTTKGPQKGTGIGLYMAKTIIEKHMGGRITARNLDGGAEFRIEI